MKKRMGIDTQQIKGMRNKVARSPKKDWKHYKQPKEQGLPMVIEASTNSGSLAGWAAQNSELWPSLLREHGVLFFRGFNVFHPADMQETTTAFLNDIFKGNTEHRAIAGSSAVQEPVLYDNTQLLLWHSENTFNQQWPGKILFACSHPAEQGGETPFVDNRTMYQHLDQAVRDEFERKGVMYVRKYQQQDRLGLGWKTVFGTEDKSVVEQKCHQQTMSVEWRDNGALVTRAIRPAVWKHAVTQENCWINQAQHWHFSCLPANTREAFATLYEPEDFARNCYFGDGTPIGDDTMQYILEQYQKFQVYQPWQRGDFVLADNLLVAHARRPFQGERKLMVCLGDMMQFS